MSYNTLKESLPSVNEQFRRSFDSDDPIRMAFRIGGLQRNGGKRGSRQTPEWALRPSLLRKILLRSFPMMNEKSYPCKNDRCVHCPYHQRLLAARWAYISYLYWSRGLTQGQIVCELNTVSVGNESAPPVWSLRKVNHVLYHLNQASQGLRSNGSGRLTGKIQGRPKGFRVSKETKQRMSDTAKNRWKKKTSGVTPASIKDEGK